MQSDRVLAGDAPDSKTPAGVVLSVTGSYTHSGTALAANSVIEMVPLPVGAIVLSVLFAAIDTVFGAARTVDVGFTGGDVDAFIDGADVSANVLAKDTGLAAAVGVGYASPLTAADTIDAIILGDTMPAGATIRVSATYMMAV